MKLLAAVEKDDGSSLRARLFLKHPGYLSRILSDALIHFAYNIAMPALLIVTIA